METTPVGRWRMQALLLTLFVCFAVTPFFEGKWVADVTGTVVIIAAFGAASTTKADFAVVLVLAALAICTIWQTYWWPSTMAGYLAISSDLAFVGLVIVLLLSYVFRARGTTRETIAAASCAYLLIGLMWADVFSLLEGSTPGSFSPIEAQGSAINILSPRELVARFNYFSFTTLSTVGYGDIVPLSRPARSLATFEAISGQLYIAVLISRLVGQSTGK